VESATLAPYNKSGLAERFNAQPVLTKRKPGQGVHIMAEANVRRKCCPGCTITKPLTDFYRHSGTSDGVQSRCKLCQLEWKRSPAGKASISKHNKTSAAKLARSRWFKTDNGRKNRRDTQAAYRKCHRAMVAARNAVRAAKGRGDIKPASQQPCTHCGRKAAGYHHHKGYEPKHHLDVIPLCKPCHFEADKVQLLDLPLP
jgi:hypothetical protein